MHTNTLSPTFADRAPDSFKAVYLVSLMTVGLSVVAAFIA